MLETVGEWVQTGLNLSMVSRIRRNHGLEHATLHILAERYPHQSMAGHSDLWGYWILGDLASENVRWAAQEALRRMQAGEHHLAVHPNCGTNYVTAGTLAGVTAALTVFSAGHRMRDKIERLPLAVTVATLALMLSQPLGLMIQERFTTSGVPGSLEIVDVIAKMQGGIHAHRIVTRG